ncbi:hypothetical protein SAMN05192566_0734 [Methylophilus rhizosphaerae]|uniref:Uncharacterized protein n=1 Tax=Methylophilus rhizosphaerae TaxID=492660 RepID=A0A1G9A7V0_9PROT|nr:hypothetical protein [Methylophilus rhizosphaerae]SDK23368.1 hypothetical protein SAMN05192566_0734 [Methylophilus rhizosphaerae]
MSTEKEFQEHLDEYNHEVFGLVNDCEEVYSNNESKLNNYEISDPIQARDYTDLLFLLPSALIWVSVYFNEIMRFFNG